MQKLRGWAARFLMTYRSSLGALGALVVLFLLEAAPAAHAQDEAAGRGALREALAGGDAQALLAQAAERVAVDLPGGSSKYSRSQAVYVLQKFFEDHPPRRFAWQRTKSSERRRFLMGRYWHEGAQQPMRVHLRLAKAQGRWTVQEVRVRRP
jgi:hypothetical protein